MTTVEPSYRAARPRLLAISAAMFAVGTNAFGIAGLLPEIAHSLEVDTAVIGWSITTYSLLVAVLSPLFSTFGARIPRRLMLAGGMGLFALGVVLTAVAPVAWVFFAGRAASALGAAALVPTGTAAAPAIAGPAARGRALALVAFGFTLALAFGSPLGTAIGDLLGWRATLGVIAALGAALAVVLALVGRGIPNPEPLALRDRLRPLGRPAVIAMLGSFLLAVASFNVVYLLAALVFRPATGGSGLALSLVLLCFGVAGIVGNRFAGVLTDRLGARTTGLVALGSIALALVAMPFVVAIPGLREASIVLWGLGGAIVQVPVQGRLVALDPANAAITMSWSSTAMYVGIGIAPLIGGAVAGAAGAPAIPLAGAVLTLVAAGLLLAGMRSPATEVTPTPARAAARS